MYYNVFRKKKEFPHKYGRYFYILEIITKNSFYIFSTLNKYYLELKLFLESS